jgi:hypothetical protein
MQIRRPTVRALTLILAGAVKSPHRSRARGALRSMTDRNPNSADREQRQRDGYLRVLGLVTAMCG